MKLKMLDTYAESYMYNLGLMFQETIWLNDNTLIANSDRLAERILRRKENSESAKLGVFGCMPEIKPSVYDGKYIRYDFTGSGLKSTIDYKSDELNELIIQFKNNFDISLDITCLIADTEARVRSDGLLKPVLKEDIRIKALKVVKRVSKTFPGEVFLRSDVFPVRSQIYRESFLKTFKGISEEVMEGNPLENPRVLSRFYELISLGAEDDIALARAVRDFALMDTEYAMEGLWITTQCDWDGLIILDNYPLSSYQRTFRLIPNISFPIVFLGPYEKF